MSAYAFRPMTADDLPMVAAWLATPDVRAWWGEAAHEAWLMKKDLTDPRTRMWIASHDGAPFAYIQDYDPRAWDAPGLDDLPVGARGVDQFIGVPEMIGRGHGSAFIRAHADRLLAEGAPLVFTDPAPDNARAVRPYEKAGFERLGERELSDGTCLLMIKHPDKPRHRSLGGA